MKLKMFVHNTLDGVEKDINEWLSNESIEVCQITQSQCEKQGKFFFVVSVLFKLRASRCTLQVREAIC